MTEMTTEERKTVISVFKDRRRPIASGDAQTERQNLLDALRVTFSDVLSCGVWSSAQTESSEWCWSIAGILSNVASCVLQVQNSTTKARVLCHSIKKASDGNALFWS